MIFFRFDRKSGDVEILSKNDAKRQMPAITKSQLIKQIAVTLDLPATDVAPIIRSFLAVITTHLKADRQLVLQGFGRFKVRKCRTGKWRNPKTGKTTKKVGRRSVTFRPSERLKLNVA